MLDWRSPAEWKRIVRYYQAGIVNTLFGYSAFSLLVAFHTNMYLAQALAHVIGMVFNYFTYSKYAFADRQASKARFILSYAANYLIGLFFIWMASLVTRSPYLAGLISIGCTSIINYFILKRLVFRGERVTHPQQST